MVASEILGMLVKLFPARWPQIYNPIVIKHFGAFVRWMKARKGFTNVRFAELIDVSDKTVGNLFTYETHDRLDDVALSRLALVLGFKNEIELIEAYQQGLPDFVEAAPSGAEKSGAEKAARSPAARSSLAAQHRKYAEAAKSKDRAKPLAPPSIGLPLKLPAFC